jgi:nicotinate-nucleotide adenylyltransferase
LIPEPRRVGFFGGAFDPPHRAHQLLAETACKELNLDELRVIPTGQAWHKERSLTTAAHRLAMARLAFAEFASVQVDPREMARTGPSYTIDTLRELVATQPDAAFFLIVGADQAQALTGWHCWQQILEIATICVAFRASAASANTVFDIEKLFPSQVHRLQMPEFPLSSTEIRAQIFAGRSVDTLLSKPVARYIADHHLYQTA